MAKALLGGYKIGGDLIDRVARDESSSSDIQASRLPHSELRDALESLERATKSESPPAGTESSDKVESRQAGAAEGGASDGENNAGEALPTASGDEEAAPVLRPERDGLFHLFTIGSLSYRVGGVRQVFVTSLRVNIRATGSGVSYYDSLDLYVARSRSGFAQALARSCGVEIARVEKDLVMILEHLERERDEALRTHEKKSAAEMSEADRELGLSLLRDPRLFERIVQDMSELGYVGEDLNKQLLYLCASSRKLDDPISVLILSQSAAGKSYLVETVRKLMPGEEVVAVTSLSDQALNYIEDLSHKFLILGEAVHGEVVEHQIREMLSGKELSRLVTVKDAETGKMQSRVVRTPVVVASVMSGTRSDLNPENMSRCFVVNADESREQTQRIHEAQRKKYSLEVLRSGRERASRVMKTHQAAQRLLRTVHVVNDFAPHVGFPTSLMRSRRDHDRFLDLIACVCFVRQYQKKEEREEALSFIRCDLEDYQVAYRIMVEGVMGSTVQELPSGAVSLYEELRAWVAAEAARQQLKSEEVSFTQRQARELTGLGHTWVKLCLRQLVDYDALAIVRGGGARARAFYRLREDAAITGIDLSMIPTPEEMGKRLSDTRKK